MPMFSGFADGYPKQETRIPYQTDPAACKSRARVNANRNQETDDCQGCERQLDIEKRASGYLSYS